ncbi:VanW family protein [Patescibacteria group bacterium AH-259-L05]|nr:VanW family protein [Patescibacteria group bacterium AH-259-L05]
MGHINLMKTEKKKISAQKRIIFYFVMIIIIIGGYFFVFDTIYASAIYPGIYCCNDFSLSGLGPEEARTLLEIFIEGVDSNGYTFYANTELGEKKAIIYPNLIALTDPDLSRSLIHFNIEATIENAYAVGREGNIFQRTFKKISSIASNKKLDLIVAVEEQEIQQMLQVQFKELEKPGENVHIVISDSGLGLEPEVTGFTLNYEHATTSLKYNLEQFRSDGIRIPIVAQEPDISYGEALGVFVLAQEVFDRGPYVVSYQDKTWEIEKKDVGQWLEFGRDNVGFVKLKFSFEHVYQYLNTIAQEINIEPREHHIVIENDRVTNFEVGAPGLALNIDKSIHVIENAVLGDKKVENINLVVETAEPASLPEDVDNLGIKELIGRGISNFSGSPKNRRHNIRVGAEKLNGILIAPNEEFSLVEALGDIDEEAGYVPELVIKGDRTVPEYGGGLCQIGTTTFRATLNAGLPITERRNHSYRVAYYEPAGMDATIYLPKPDYRFINDTDHHILIQTKIQGDELIFEFYGTYDRRIVKTEEPEIYNIVDPGPPRYIETDKLLPGEKKKVESSHFGASAKLKNTIVYANGIERVDLWRSYYKPWPEVWMVGREIKNTDEADNNE